jgi:Polyferredoxin
MAKKIKKSQVLRHVIQLIMFLTLPGLYAMTFSELKIVYEMIVNGNFNFLQAFPSLVEFTAVMLLTILMGRWFCGWLCAFGAYNDLIYSISKKVFKTKFKVNEKVDSVLKYAKYVILVFIIIISWTMGSSILESTSPWDVFGQITNISNIISNLLIGLILLFLITIGAAFIERFFCRYLCPLGAVFAIISKIGIVKINKPKADCGKCRACTVNCSMGLKLYKVNGARGGDCINCLKCTEVCPRNNANVNILGQDVNQNLAGTVAMAAMLGIYGLSNFEADALTNSGVISNQTENSISVASNSTSQKYKDGTYTGTGIGFNGGTTKVAVTIADGKITKIDTLSNGDHQYFSRASGIIIKNIISKQTASVDTVSGATFSSKGIISAVKDALSQAGASESSDTTDNTSLTSESATSNATESTASNVVDNTKTPNSKYKDGTYTGTGTGFDGATTKISVTIANGKITNIKTISNGDTPEFYSQASSGIIGKIISTQSASVDTVSGATFSSNGIISAVKNALNQAAGSDSKVDQASTSSKSASAANSGTSNNNTTQSQPTTPPPAANQKSTSAPSTSTAAQGSKNTATSPSTNANTSNSNKGQYKDGTYTGSGSGFGGTTSIAVTISNGKITGIKTISNDDTQQYYNRAIGKITNSVISSQSGSVDTVSGATYSSRGIIQAVKDALSQAK